MNNKDKIIHAALELFAKNGYTETSIDKIARHANVSKGLTYTHFKNKEELLVITIERTITQMTSEMMELDQMTFEKFCKAFFDGLKVNTDTIRLCLLLVTHPQTPSKVNVLMEKQKQELLELLSMFLSEKYREEAKIEAELLLATIDGITLEYVTNPNPEHLETIHKHLLKKYSL